MSASISDRLEALGFGRPGVEIDAAVHRLIDEIQASRTLLPKLVEALEKLLLDRHVHAGRGDGTDMCARCMRDIREDVHFRAGETRETDRQQAKEALTLARRKEGV